MFSTSRIAIWGLSVTSMLLGTTLAFGQDYPNKLIRIVTGGVGGSNDFASRIIAQGLSSSLNQPVLVENRPSGPIPGEQVSKALPDGYTLLVQGSNLWTGTLFQKTPFDPIADFSPITLTTIEPNLLVVHPSLPAKSVGELIALAKARPGELNNSFGSIGGSEYNAGELFKAMARVNIVSVRYTSSSQELVDLIAGRMQMTFQSGTKVAPYIKSGKLRALAVTTAQSSALYPNLPTVAAAGLPEFESVAIFGMFAPAKTPTAIINLLNRETVRVLNRQDVKEKFLNAGSEVVGNSPEEFSKKIKSEMALVSKLIKQSGIKVE